MKQILLEIHYLHAVSTLALGDVLPDLRMEARRTLPGSELLTTAISKIIRDRGCNTRAAGNRRTAQSFYVARKIIEGVNSSVKIKILVFVLPYFDSKICVRPQ